MLNQSRVPACIINLSHFSQQHTITENLTAVTDFVAFFCLTFDSTFLLVGACNY